MALARLRTVKEAAKWLKEQDPDSAVGEWFIRQRIADGSLPFIRAGNRHLVNLAALESLLDGGQVEKPDCDEDYQRPRVARID